MSCRQFIPAGLPRTITVDLTGKLPTGARRIRIVTNLQIYWDQALVDNGPDHPDSVRTTELPLSAATLAFRGYPQQVEGTTTPGDLTYYYGTASMTGPFEPPLYRISRRKAPSPRLASACHSLFLSHHQVPSGS